MSLFEGGGGVAGGLIAPGNCLIVNDPAVHGLLSCFLINKGAVDRNQLISVMTVVDTRAHTTHNNKINISSRIK